MNIQEIKQAISELSPKELVQFRKWFKEFENKRVNKSSIEKRLAKLQGSLKGKGALKTLMQERHRG